jgi:hypothetical protein
LLGKQNCSRLQLHRNQDSSIPTYYEKVVGPEICTVLHKQSCFRLGCNSIRCTRRVVLSSRTVCHAAAGLWRLLTG